MKVKEFIEKSAEILKENEIGEARLNSEYIISGILNISRPEVFLNGERTLSSLELKKAEKYLALKLKGYPLSWILKKHDFNGVELAVSPGVFVPRPETEELAVLALKETQGRGGRPRILDFCSGSGCIAVFLALKNPSLDVFAVEKSFRGFKCASLNAAKHALKNLRLARSARIGFFGKKFDVVVSNPPYIPSGVIGNLDIEVRKEPRAALDGGADGLDMVRLIEREAGKIMNPGGKLFLEFGDGQAEKIRGIFGTWKSVSVLGDLNGKSRFLKAGGPANGQLYNKRRK
ncbi:MAG: peptide chain release factor N(5)-glutamine methyltransferase [Elusimicrobia bacterium CG08_land_8_20_14_0_20_51_18]|nr:MAG: peptide chain release factor N(5)-glutamine methyltransferase [Elusimicrobia bacterium CG08_land_8_20_14_0_20_51_18]